MASENLEGENAGLFLEVFQVGQQFQSGRWLNRRLAAAMSTLSVSFASHGSTQRARQTLRLKLRDLGLSVARPGEAEEDDPVSTRPHTHAGPRPRLPAGPSSWQIFHSAR